MSVPTIEKRDALYTWTHYRNWPEGERWEIIDGTAYAMSPAPSTKHQSVSARMYSRLERGVTGTPCRAFIAPTDVKLSEQDVVQPDILVVCDPAKITATHIEGAPEVVVEVLSPNTSAKDLREKKALYERSAVKEYVVVDPLEHYAMRFLNSADGFDKGTVFGPDQMLVVATLEGLEVPLWEVFEVEGPGDAQVPVEGPPAT